jgi:thiol-disulfide isomerase/thioredoxin
MVSSPVMHNQIWLNGEKILIKGKIDKKLIVDTIIGSSLYYGSKRTGNGLTQLFSEKVEDSIINNFNFKQIKENIDNPLSLALSDNYIRRNKNNLENLSRLNELLKNQNGLLKNHSFFKPHIKLEKALSVNSLDFSQYKFYNLKKELSTIQLKNDKRYIIDFWFVNCPPCVKDHKYISSKKDWIKSNGIELIGISNDKDHELFKRYISQNNYEWENYREVDSLKLIRDELDIKAFPTYVIVDDGTKIVKTFNSFEKVENYLSN